MGTLQDVFPTQVRHRGNSRSRFVFNLQLKSELLILGFQALGHADKRLLLNERWGPAVICSHCLLFGCTLPFREYFRSTFLSLPERSPG